MFATTSTTPTAATASLSAPEALAPSGEKHAPGMYGPRGWSVQVGMWRLLAHWVQPLRGIDLALTGSKSPALIDSAGRPLKDYIPFQGLDAATARRLLEILPAAVLRERQNEAPTLGCLLRVCAGADGQVRLSGYGIGYQRHDERMSVEALWVADPDLLELRVDPKHRSQCQCDLLWSQVVQRYELDALNLPDEILRIRPQWAGGAQGWWLWWD